MKRKFEKTTKVRINIFTLFQLNTWPQNMYKHAHLMGKKKKPEHKNTNVMRIKVEQKRKSGSNRGGRREKQKTKMQIPHKRETKAI